MHTSKLSGYEAEILDPAHVHMYEYFGGVAKILVPDTLQDCRCPQWRLEGQQINETYQEMGSISGTAIIPKHVQDSKGSPIAEGT